MFTIFNDMKEQLRTRESEQSSLEARVRESDERLAMHAEDQAVRDLVRVEQETRMAATIHKLKTKLNAEKNHFRGSTTRLAQTKKELARRIEELDLWRYHTVSVEAKLRQEKTLRALDQTYVVDACRLQDRVDDLETRLSDASRAATLSSELQHTLTGESRVLRRAILRLDDEYKEADVDAERAEGDVARLQGVVGDLRSALVGQVKDNAALEEAADDVQGQLYRANRTLADFVAGRHGGAGVGAGVGAGAGMRTVGAGTGQQYALRGASVRELFVAKPIDALRRPKSAGVGRRAGAGVGGSNGSEGNAGGGGGEGGHYAHTRPQSAGAIGGLSHHKSRTEQTEMHFAACADPLCGPNSVCGLHHRRQARERAGYQIAGPCGSALVDGVLGVRSGRGERDRRRGAGGNGRDDRGRGGDRGRDRGRDGRGRDSRGKRKNNIDECEREVKDINGAVISDLLRSVKHSEQHSKHSSARRKRPSSAVPRMQSRTSAASRHLVANPASRTMLVPYHPASSGSYESSASDMSATTGSVVVTAGGVLQQAVSGTVRPSSAAQVRLRRRPATASATRRSGSSSRQHSTSTDRRGASLGKSKSAAALAGGGAAAAVDIITARLASTSTTTQRPKSGSRARPWSAVGSRSKWDTRLQSDADEFMDRHRGTSGGMELAGEFQVSGSRRGRRGGLFGNDVDAANDDEAAAKAAATVVAATAATAAVAAAAAAEANAAADRVDRVVEAAKVTASAGNGYYLEHHSSGAGLNAARPAVGASCTTHAVSQSPSVVASYYQHGRLAITGSRPEASYYSGTETSYYGEQTRYNDRSFTSSADGANGANGAIGGRSGGAVQQGLRRSHSSGDGGLIVHRRADRRRAATKTPKRKSDAGRNHSHTDPVNARGKNRPQRGTRGGRGNGSTGNGGTGMGGTGKGRHPLRNVNGRRGAGVEVGKRSLFVGCGLGVRKQVARMDGREGGKKKALGPGSATHMVTQIRRLMEANCPELAAMGKH